MDEIPRRKEVGTITRTEVSNDPPKVVEWTPSENEMVQSVSGAEIEQFGSSEYTKINICIVSKQWWISIIC